MLPETARQLLEKMQSLMTAGKIMEKSRIVFVNDGSKDRTWELIQKFHAENPIYQGISLSRNRGHQNALLAADDGERTLRHDHFAGRGFAGRY